MRYMHFQWPHFSGNGGPTAKLDTGHISSRVKAKADKRACVVQDAKQRSKERPEENARSWLAQGGDRPDHQQQADMQPVACSQAQDGGPAAAAAAAAGAAAGTTAEQRAVPAAAATAEQLLWRPAGRLWHGHAQPSASGNCRPAAGRSHRGLCLGSLAHAHTTRSSSA